MREQVAQGDMDQTNADQPILQEITEEFILETILASMLQGHSITLLFPKGYPAFKVSSSPPI